MLRARAAPEGGRVARSWPSSQLRGEGGEVGSVDGVRGPGEIADGVVVGVGVGGKQHGRLADADYNAIGNLTGWTLIDPDVGHAPQEFWSVGRVGGQVW